MDTDANLGEVDGVRIAAVGPVRYRHPRSISGVLSDFEHGDELLLVDDRVVFRCTKLLPNGDLCHATFDSALALVGHSNRGRHYIEKENESMAKPTPADVVKKVATATSNGRGSVTTRELLVTSIEELAGALYEVGGRLVDARNGLIKLADQVKDLKPEIQVVEPDPELVEKARKYDALRGLMQ